MFVTNPNIRAAVGAAGVSLFVSSEIGAVLFGIAFQYFRGPVQIIGDFLFALLTLSFFAWYCVHAYRVERKIQQDDLQIEQVTKSETIAQ